MAECELASCHLTLIKKFLASAFKAAVNSFLETCKKSNLTKETTVSLVKPKRSVSHAVSERVQPVLDAFSGSDTEEESEGGNESQNSVNVTVVNRPSACGDLPTAQAFLLGLVESKSKETVNLLRLSPSSTAESVNAQIENDRSDNADFRLAIADIPYGLKKGSWDEKPWGERKVSDLANWVVKFSEAWAGTSQAFTLVIFCAME